ncbi:hypothetical protein AALP_AAs68488U001000 [Arabis alpina]|uniref:Uncharacterized protein n=1 Tax=Arabis alpina TaxID=50452 RepID=A0A087FY47_ARAAL|nr:hypothetical protein AALP_AAs68488U001000 [Arabis alpina]
MAALSVLRELFTEAEMMMLHRVHLEMLYSNPLQLIETSVHDSGIEVVILDDDNDADTDMDLSNPNGTPPPPPNQANGHPDTGARSGNENGYSGEAADGPQGYRQFGDVGVNLLDTYMQSSWNTRGYGLGQSVLGWDGIMTEDYPFDEESYLLVEEERFYALPAEPISPVNPNMQANDENGEDSSTGSSSELCLMADYEVEHNLALMDTPSSLTPLHQPPASTDQQIPGNGIAGTRIGGDVSSFEGKGQGATPGVSNASQPFLGLTLTCGPNVLFNGNQSDSEERGSASAEKDISGGF